MHRRLQFSMRENPASDPRHGSRLAVSCPSNQQFVAEENLPRPAPEPSPIRSRSPLNVRCSQHATGLHAATEGGNTDDSRLMTVDDVAELLQVPSSWVYEHTRHRCQNRIPGIRLGKYWRFQRTEVNRWLDANCKKD